MSDERVDKYEGGSTPGWIAVIVLGLIAIAGVGFGLKASGDTSATKTDLTTQIAALKQTSDTNVAQLQSRLTDDEKANTQLESDLTVVTKKLNITQGQLRKAREEAQQIRDDNQKQLADMDTAVKGELATKASTDDVKSVATDVSGVRTDLTGTQNDLKMARSELGTLIARNHDEVQELRRLGERDYIEFTIAQKNQPQKVGSVTVELRGTNPKHNQFNVAVTVNDKRTEKKNRNADEPIFFYVHGTKQPLELVVNQIDKNKITGYLSVPKANTTVAAGSSN
ncbi:MAG: hypothetical protein ACRD50_12115 [Candidatus Acidiferrales bacterium]